MLVNSVHRHIQQKNIREGNCYFQDTILKQFWYFFIDLKCTHHNLGTQIKILCKLVWVTKGNLFLSLIERKTHDFISGVFMFLSYIQPIKENIFAILRYCCLCCFRTSYKIFSNLNFFWIFLKGIVHQLWKWGALKCNHLVTRNWCT